MKFILRALSLCLALLLLVPSLCAPARSAEQTERTVHTAQAVLSPGAILSAVLAATEGERATEAELTYLNDYAEGDLFYSSVLPGELVHTEREGATLTVRADGYTDVLSNGRRVHWIPARALCDGQEKAFEADGTGALRFESVAADATVTVYYRGSTALEKDRVNSLLNFAYRDAETARESSAVLDAYATAMREYRQYLELQEQYELDLATYEAYLEERAQYDRASLAYLENQRAWAAYRPKKQAYDDYLAAQTAYESAMITYREEYARYEETSAAYSAYVSNLGAIRTAMSAMYSIYLRPSENLNTLYSALQNAELVTMFEKYQGLLTENFGVPQQKIRELRAHSDRLNVLLRRFDEEQIASEERAFAYYLENYEEINQLFNYLYDEMSTILTPTVYNLICAKLDVEYGSEMGSYKKWRIKNVLCHIYLVCLCLDDTQEATDSWPFYADDGDPHLYYFSDLLHPQLIISDTGHANPRGLTWLTPVEPIAPPTMPLAPTPVVKPVEPPTVKKPIMPTAVPKPTPPAVKIEPEEPKDVDYANLLRTEPILAVAMEERSAVREDVTVWLPTLCVSVATHGGATVYGRDGGIRADLTASDLPQSMATERDAAFTYTFLGWSSSLTELTPVGSDSRYVYPLYSVTPNLYTVRFTVGDTVHTQQVSYGEIPVFAGSVDRPSDGNYTYTFSTWNPPLKPIRQQGVSFVASYTETQRYYTVTFDMTNRVLTRQYTWQAIPTCPVAPTSFIQDGVLYEFTGWDKAFGPVTEDVTYTAQYRTTVLAAGGEEDGEGEEGDEPTFDLTVSPAGYTLTGSGSSFEIANLVDYVRSKEKELELVFLDHGLTVLLNEEMLAELDRIGAARMIYERESGKGGRIRLRNADGNELVSGKELRLRLKHGLEGDEHVYLNAYYADGACRENLACTCADGTMEFLAEVGVYYRALRKFTLTVKVGENGTAVAGSDLFAEGSPLAVTIRPDAEYRLRRLVLRNPATEETLEASSLEELTMPAYDAELLVEFEPILYTVEFQYHGGSTKQTYRLGETVTVPEIATSFEEDGYYYTFTGWSVPVTLVTGDAVYTAKYYKVRVEDRTDNGEGGAIGRVLLRFGLPALLIVAAVAAAILVPVVLVKRKKKKRNEKGSLPGRKTAGRRNT